MNSSVRLFVATLVGLVIACELDAQKSAPTNANAAPATTNISAAAQSQEQENLEAKFKTALTRAVFTGRWCLIKDGKLGEDKEDRYTINSAVKIAGNLWLINARIQYGDKDMVVPVPVSVKWAGDTPVISITNVGVPGLGTYTARVVIYDNTYAGTWSGGDHRGLLSGIISSTLDSGK